MPPDIILLKECSSYFPGDLPLYQAKTKDFVRRVQARGIRMILTTVVPVTRSRAAKDAGKLQSLRQFNDWIREFAAQSEIVVLDLDSALRVPDGGGYLRDDFTSGDGSHLNTAAYAVLDQELKIMLKGTTASWQMRVQH
jgi:hypothetical protein